MPAVKRDADVPRSETFGRLLTQLNEALSLIDKLGDYPVLGARLQGIIDEIRVERDEEKP